MPKLPVKKLSVFEFGKQLIETRDLDPVYCVLWEAKLEPLQLRRWILAYLCFYHCGTASWIADEMSYWGAMEKAAASKEYLRCPERRHFRGKNAIDSVAYLKSQGIKNLFFPFNEHPMPLEQALAWVSTWKGFGPWAQFKAADLIERLDICPIQFRPDDVFGIYKSPREGAEIVAKQLGCPSTCDPVDFAYNSVMCELGHLEAPPSYDRPINIQEIETVFCKFHSHCNGKYQIGHDITEVKHGLEHYPKSVTARRLLRVGKDAELW